MNHITKGKRFRKEMSIDLYLSDRASLSDYCPHCLRVVLVPEGSFLLECSGQRFFVEAPAVLCLNKDLPVKILKGDDTGFPTFYFKPMVINSLFTYDFLENPGGKELSQTEQQDQFWLAPFLDENPHGLNYIKLGPESCDRSRSLFESVQRERTEQPDGFWPCRSRSLFLEFLYYLSSIIREYQEYKSPAINDGGLLEDIRYYLHNHYNEELTLEELARRFNTNRTKINSLFAESTGKSAIAYLIDLRIRLACLILRDTTVPVKEIVYRIGFNDISHFGRTFKKLTGETPSRYRENYNWMLRG